MAPHALGVHGGLERRRGTNGLFAVTGGAGVFLPLLPYELVQLFVIHMVQTPQFSSELAGLTIALELTCR